MDTFRNVAAPEVVRLDNGVLPPMAAPKLVVVAVTPRVYAPLIVAEVPNVTVVPVNVVFAPKVVAPL